MSFMVRACRGICRAEIRNTNVEIRNKLELNREITETPISLRSVLRGGGARDRGGGARDKWQPGYWASKRQQENGRVKWQPGYWASKRQQENGRAKWQPGYWASKWPQVIWAGKRWPADGRASGLSFSDFLFFGFSDLFRISRFGFRIFQLPATSVLCPPSSEAAAYGKSGSWRTGELSPQSSAFRAPAAVPKSPP